MCPSGYFPVVDNVSHASGEAMSFTSPAFDRRLAAFERAEAGLSGRPLGDLTLARVALARRLGRSGQAVTVDAAAMSAGPAFLIRA